MAHASQDRTGRPTVVPRWEWRTFFGSTLPADISALIGSSADSAPAGPETYILSGGSPHNVKIRDGQLEIKWLEEVDRGLERWRPVLVTPFPVDADDIRAACDAWMLPPPVLLPRHASIDEFLLEIVRPIALLRVVRLTKRRARMALFGCAAECAALEIEGSRWYTLALEDADPSRVIEAVGRLPLQGRPNMSYPTALKQIAGLTSGPALAAEEVIW